jgi:hypothetical protein
MEEELVAFGRVPVGYDAVDFGFGGGTARKSSVVVEHCDFVQSSAAAP